MAETPKTEIFAGKPVLSDGKIIFGKPRHPRYIDAQGDYNDAKRALEDTAKEGMRKTRENLFNSYVSSPEQAGEPTPGAGFADRMDIATRAAMGDPVALAHPELDQQMMATIQESLKQNAPKEFEALTSTRSALNQVNLEIAEAQHELLKNLKPEQVVSSSETVTGKHIEEAIAAKAQEIDALSGKTMTAVKAAAPAAAAAAATPPAPKQPEAPRVKAFPEKPGHFDFRRKNVERAETVALEKLERVARDTPGDAELKAAIEAFKNNRAEGRTLASPLADKDAIAKINEQLSKHAADDKRMIGDATRQFEEACHEATLTHPRYDFVQKQVGLAEDRALERLERVARDNATNTELAEAVTAFKTNRSAGKTLDALDATTRAAIEKQISEHAGDDGRMLGDARRMLDETKAEMAEASKKLFTEGEKPASTALKEAGKVMEKINPGSAHFENGKIVFKDASHPGMKAAEEKLVVSQGKLTAKVATSPAMEKEIAALSTDKGALALAQEAAFGNAARLADPTVNKDLVKKIEAIAEKHVPAELKEVKAAKKAVDTLVVELRTEQIATLKKMDVTKVGNYAEKDRAAIQGAMAEFEKETNELKKLLATNVAKEGNWLMRHFEVLKTEGFVAALNYNIGKEAWGASKTKAAFNTVGTAVGIGAMIDAVGRSQTQGPDGRPESRSWVGRTAEGVIGAVIAGGSALRGHR